MPDCSDNQRGFCTRQSDSGDDPFPRLASLVIALADRYPDESTSPGFPFAALLWWNTGSCAGTLADSRGFHTVSLDPPHRLGGMTCERHLPNRGSGNPPKRPATRQVYAGFTTRQRGSSASHSASTVGRETELDCERASYDFMGGVPTLRPQVPALSGGEPEPSIPFQVSYSPSVFQLSVRPVYETAGGRTRTIQ